MTTFTTNNSYTVPATPNNQFPATIVNRTNHYVDVKLPYLAEPMRKKVETINWYGEETEAVRINGSVIVAAWPW